MRITTQPLDEADPGAATWPRPEAEVFELKAELSRLPERQRLAFLLYEIKGLSHREAAAELGISYTATVALVFRARRALADGLADSSIGFERARRIPVWGSLLGFARPLLEGGTAVKIGVAVGLTSLAVAPLSADHGLVDTTRVLPASPVGTQSGPGGQATAAPVIIRTPAGIGAAPQTSTGVDGSASPARIPPPLDAADATPASSQQSPSQPSAEPGAPSVPATPPTKGDEATGDHGHIPAAAPDEAGNGGATDSASGSTRGVSGNDDVPGRTPQAHNDPTGPPDDPGAQSQGNGNGPPAEPGAKSQGNGPPADPGAKSQGNGNGPPADPGAQNQGNGNGPPADPGAQSQGNGNGPPADPGAQNQGNGNGPPADPGAQSQGNGNGPPADPGAKSQGNGNGPPADPGSQSKKTPY